MVARLIGLLVVVGVCLSGCTAPQNLKGGAYASEFAALAEDTGSDFVRAVLSDGVITEAEYQEAREKVEDCLAGLGVEGSYQPDQLGGYSLLTGELTEAQQQQLVECREQWIDGLEWLYQAVKNNPQNISEDDLIAACFVRHGVAPEGYRGVDYHDLIWSNGVTDLATAQHDSEGGLLPQPALTLPGGVSLDDPVAARCRISPTGW
ncbi:MAG: hypothetical protein LBG70_04770 [Bifidobacteriaceae bacterium]|nr:hypothetical protein [Bifidobacteriaceae bacterium]